MLTKAPVDQERPITLDSGLTSPTQIQVRLGRLNGKLTWYRLIFSYMVTWLRHVTKIACK